MRAARIHTWASPPVLEEIAEPRPKPGEVLVEVQAAALSHLDLSVASGTFDMHPELPYVGGVEASGTVLSADDIECGTQVLIRGAGIGLLRDGTWAERISVPRKAITTLPMPLAPEVAATFFQPTSTAFVVLHDVARLDDCESVIVVGAAGAVGAQVVQQALAAGAQVMGVVSRPEQLQWLPAGAVPLLLDDALMRRLAEERAASLLVDTLGGSGLRDRLGWVRAGGRAVVVGYVAGTAVELDLPSWLLTDVALLPVNMIRNERRAREVAPDLVRRLAAGELRVDVQSFGLDDIAAGLSLLRAGRVRGRAAVRFGEPVGPAGPVEPAGPAR
jgi:NADPH:quinone reductase-like Zn-dependent oxidoreductase